MKLKLLALAGVSAFALWFALVGGRQMSQDDVRLHYARYASAFDRADAKAVCDLFDERVHGRFRSTSSRIKVPEVVSKAQACQSVDEFQRVRRQLQEATGQEMFTNIEYTITDIALSPDRKTATVQVLMEMRVGTSQGALIDMRSTQTDVIQRRWGRTRFVQTDGSVSFYR